MKHSIIAALFLLLNSSDPSHHLRINQVGYLSIEHKTTNLFFQKPLDALTFSIIRESDGTTVQGPASVGAEFGAYSGGCD